MLKRYSNIIFDLDGTLIDSAGDIFACLEKSFMEIVGSLDKLPDKTCLGMPLKEIVLTVKPGLQADELAEVCACFRRTYDSSEYPGTALMPGVLELLPRLSHEGLSLFVATNKPIKPTLRIISKLGISELFKEVVSPDSIVGQKMSKSEILAYLVNKWKLDCGKTIMVGDSEPDILAAKKNEIVSVYLISGYGSNTAAADLKPDVVLPDLKALPKIL